MNDEKKVGVGFTNGIGVHNYDNYATSEIEFLRYENSRLKLELEEIKYKIMKDDVEKGLDLNYYFMTHWNKDERLGLVADGQFLKLFGGVFDREKCQMLIDKYSYDDVVKVVKNFCEELVQEQEEEQEEEVEVEDTKE